MPTCSECKYLQSRICEMRRFMQTTIQYPYWECCRRPDKADRKPADKSCVYFHFQPKEAEEKECDRSCRCEEDE